MRYGLSLLIAILPITFAGQLPVREVWGQHHAAKEEVHDEELARQALENGEILPLDRVMARLKEMFPGDISGLELEKENGIWIYEFKLISPAGRMVKVRIDAKTGMPTRKVEK